MSRCLQVHSRWAYLPSPDCRVHTENSPFPAFWISSLMLWCNVKREAEDRLIIAPHHIVYHLPGSFNFTHFALSEKMSAKSVFQLKPYFFLVCNYVWWSILWLNFHQSLKFYNFFIFFCTIFYICTYFHPLGKTGKFIQIFATFILLWNNSTWFFV